MLKFINRKLLIFLVLLCVVFALILLVKDLRGKSAFPFISRIQDYPFEKELFEQPRNESSIHVCLSVDEHDLVGMITLVNSISKNTKEKVIFHILCQENIREHIQNWLNLPELKPIQYDLKVISEDDLDRIKLQMNEMETSSFQRSPMNVARLYYTQYFPDIKEKALHLDADCLVLGDIAELYRTKLKPGDVIAASDDCSSSMKRFLSFPPVLSSYINFNNPNIAKMDLKPTECSFNTGVYLFSIPLWIKNNITRQVEKWMIRNKEDEVFGAERGGGLTGPPFMIVLHDKYTKFPDPRWNVRHLGMGTSKRFSPIFVKSAKLLHWSGPHKPWGVMAQLASLWDQYHVPDPSGIHTPVRRAKNHAKRGA